MEPAATSMTGAPDWAQIDAEIRCPLCEYDLRMLTVPRCPECGYRFTWEELLDPARRLHPYLFEHHPEANAWSFWRTFVGGVRPTRFWTSLHAKQPIRPGRLMLYWGMVVLLIGAAVAVAVGAKTFELVQDIRSRRAVELKWVQSGAPPDVRAQILQRHGTPQRFVDAMVPPPDSPRRIWAHMQYTRIPGAMLLCGSLLLVYPWVTVLALLVFRYSMRQARVRPAHVLRCVIYSSDVLVWFGMLATFVPLGSLLGTGLWPGMQLRPSLIFLGLALWGVAAYRLYAAYRRYMRFDRPLATTLSAQIITFLVLANIYGPLLL